MTICIYIYIYIFGDLNNIQNVSFPKVTLSAGCQQKRIDPFAEAAAHGMIPSRGDSFMQNIHSTISTWRERDREWKNASIRVRESERDTYRNVQTHELPFDEPFCEMDDSLVQTADVHDLPFEEDFYGSCGFDSP